MKLIFKKIKENAVIPFKTTLGSAGFDVCACLDEPLTIAPNEIKMIPTGLTAMPDSKDIALLIYPRSGLSSRYGISLANCVGVIDSDYRGEWIVPLINHGNLPFTIENGMRIAQLIPTKIPEIDIEVSDFLDETERGINGFGSTGNK